MLHEEVELYSRLTGNDGYKTPISIIGAYLDGYEKGKADAQHEIIRCKDCKFNPKYEWFGCPMSHLSEKQRPKTAWCWKAERRTE